MTLRLHDKTYVRRTPVGPVRWSLAVVLVLVLPGCLQNGFGFGPDKVGPNEGWPDVDEARLRPGAQLFVAAGKQSLSQCTAGFLFQSADNATLYLSFAAHCLGEDKEKRGGIGTDVLAHDGDGDLYAIGDVAYDGWANGRDLSRDFALVAIRNVEGARDETHPAMRHWGGPTGMANTDTLLPGTGVVTYGASSKRPTDSPDNVKQGRFVSRDELPDNPVFNPTDGSRQLLVRLEPSSQGGDSGSGLMLADGAAAGILSLGGSLLLGGQPVEETRYSTFVPLDQMVEEARRAGGDLYGLRLVTWDMLVSRAAP